MLFRSFEVWTEIFKDTWRTKSWKDKFRVWISRPKWRPKDVSEKFPIQKNDLRDFKKYDPKAKKHVLFKEAKIK